MRIRDELYQPIGDMQAECDILHILSSAILEVILWMIFKSMYVASKTYDRKVSLNSTNLKLCQRFQVNSWILVYSWVFDQYFEIVDQ